MNWTRLALIEHLISQNTELINQTAIKNCHCMGLNSFIINEKPRMRLFIAEKTCELYMPVTPRTPIIPIHAHKYQDVFWQIEGSTYHNMYELGSGILFNSYTYNRLNSDSNPIEDLGMTSLRFTTCKHGKEFHLEANELHTVYITPNNEGKCSWLITECKEDKGFKQVCYHPNLENKTGLYQPFPNASEFLNEYFELNH